MIVLDEVIKGELLLNNTKKKQKKGNLNVIANDLKGKNN